MRGRMDQRSDGGERGRKRGSEGASEGWKLQGRYPEEDTGQIQYTVHKTTHIPTLALVT